ncbi:MAG: AmpG family muropeptide MFS transporter [Alphaproteobacteria bacterium]|nr:AmpG family muropeptide MFS transporter [Alphaproteobacteria bacterium]
MTGMGDWVAAVRVYRDPRIFAVLLLGFSSGLPLALTGSTLAVWMAETGVSLKEIGFFSLVGTPYVFKFLWAPLVDRLPLPLLTAGFGRRRGWMLFTQALLILAIVMLGATNPAESPWNTALWAVLVAFCSASQDIVIDAWRVEILKEEQYGAGAAAVQFGYRIAMLTSGAGALFLAGVAPWPGVYAVAGGLVGIGMLTVLLSPEPPTVAAPPAASAGAVAWVRDAVAEPFQDMIQRHGMMVVAILCFVLLYKLGDALAGMMSNPFYIQMGFSKGEIASVSKLFGFVATILGTFLGGVAVARFGIPKSLMVCGVLQMLSNLMFAAQAMAGHDIAMLTATIGIENLAGGMGSAAFVAYLSRLCGLGYTGTQYALLSSLAAFGRTVISSSGGVMVEAMGWVSFFLLSTAAALPGLLLLAWMMRRGRADSPRPAPGWA